MQRIVSEMMVEAKALVKFLVEQAAKVRDGEGSAALLRSTCGAVSAGRPPARRDGACRRRSRPRPIARAALGVYNAAVGGDD